jgi:hypothetical protein
MRQWRLTIASTEEEAGMTNKLWRSRSGAVMASLAALAPVAWASAAAVWTTGPAFSVTVSLSPKAAARLAHPKDTIMISADFYGDSNGKNRKLENDVGEIDLAPSRKDEIPGAGTAQFHGPKYDKAKLAYVDANGLQVLINVFSGRHSSPDNLLDCDLFQDKIALAAKGIAIHCKLIGE